MTDDRKFAGLLISSHCVKDTASKEAAMKKLYGWERKEFPIGVWLSCLENGQVVVLGDFKKDDRTTPEGTPRNKKTFGKYTHDSSLWQSTSFIFADGDNFRGVSTSADGEELDPNGVEPWTEQDGLSKRYPAIKDKVFAVGQSVSSMADWLEVPHRRYRLVFRFNKPIVSVEHYKHVHQRLEKEFPVITGSERQPAQPVCGNARPETKAWHTFGNILDLDTYLSDFRTEPPRSRLQGADPSLREYLEKHGIAYEPCSKNPGRYFVECPNKRNHTGQHQGPTDSYVMESDGRYGWGFHCSHAHCKESSWEFFREKSNLPLPTPQRTVKQNHLSGQQVEAVFTDDEVDVGEDVDAPISFPEHLFEIEPFGLYRDAHMDRVPMSDAYAFAGLKHVIASILGRKVYIESDPTVFPNLFTAFIGNSADAAKGNAFKQARRMLSACDPNVSVISALATPEGLINQFVTPIEKEDEDGNVYFVGGFATDMADVKKIFAILNARCLQESVRISGFFGEFGSILRKAGKQNASGLLELLMQLYDAEDDIKSPTKVNPTTAEYPTFSMAAATDKRLIEGVLKDAYISGGFTNRFEWFLGDAVESKFVNDTVDQKKWNACVGIIGELRNKFSAGTDAVAFEVSSEANALGQRFTDQFTEYLSSDEMADTMKADSLKRARMHVLKNALIFAAIQNKPDETVVDETHVQQAIALSEFTTSCTQDIFQGFATTLNKQVEDKILNYLRKNPDTSLKVTANHTRCDVQTVEKTMETLVRNHIVRAKKEKRKFVYAVIKEDAI